VQLSPSEPGTKQVIDNDKDTFDTTAKEKSHQETGKKLDRV